MIATPRRTSFHSTCAWFPDVAMYYANKHADNKEGGPGCEITSMCERVRWTLREGNRGRSVRKVMQSWMIPSSHASRGSFTRSSQILHLPDRGTTRMESRSAGSPE